MNRFLWLNLMWVMKLLNLALWRRMHIPCLYVCSGSAHHHHLNSHLESSKVLCTIERLYDLETAAYGVVLNCPTTQTILAGPCQFLAILLFNKKGFFSNFFFSNHRFLQPHTCKPYHAFFMGKSWPQRRTGHVSNDRSSLVKPSRIFEACTLCAKTDTDRYHSLYT